MATETIGGPIQFHRRIEDQPMSRDEVVFTKKAIVVVAVISSLGAIAIPSVILGWQTAQALAMIEMRAKEAIEQVRSSVSDVNTDLKVHEAGDVERERRVDKIENRLEKIEGKLK